MERELHNETDINIDQSLRRGIKPKELRNIQNRTRIGERRSKFERFNMYKSVFYEFICYMNV